MLSGSFVVAGTGQTRVTAVGGHSYAAGLQAEAQRFSLIRSELQQGINQILRLVTSEGRASLRRRPRLAGHTAWRVPLVAAMVACALPLLAIPLARTVFAVHLPPGSVLLEAGGVTAGAIVALTLWFRFRPAD